ncbi:hypothetical protein ANCCEY_03377 [Ancylostoma ceylanicum]|uniref:Uncharacterized protein n=1 Tax=Ancylostoma ceylanicum TaxID=53326 RepID=A0A0D6LZS2_9BILA|nr:hypothetical protein ANCCEY_03377 [Ancylostoma ceylanicum]
MSLRLLSSKENARMEHHCNEMGCGETEQLVNNTAFQLVLGSQAIAGFLSGVVSVIVTIKCGTLHFHVNCRILIIATLLLYILHSCLITALQFAMVAERSIALWKRNNYETYGPRLGIMFAVVSVIIALAATTWAMWQEDFHQSPIIPYYTFISPILMWFVIRYSQRLKATKLKLLTQRVSSENDVYFKTYSEMNHTGTIL